MKQFIVIPVVVLTLVVIVSRWLPWWAAAVLIPATVLGIIRYSWWRVGRFLSQGITEGMETHTLVLRGATVQIHRVQLVDPPPHIRAMDDEVEEEDVDDDDEEDDEEDGDEGSLIDREAMKVNRYVSVEMTVIPDPSALEAPNSVTEPERTWDPMALNLAAIDDPKPGLLDMLIGAATARMVECLDDRGTVLWTKVACTEDEEEDEDEASEHHIDGPSRLRVLFGVPGFLADRVRLRYCMVEDLTTLTLPERNEDGEPDGTEA